MWLHHQTLKLVLKLGKPKAIIFNISFNDRLENSESLGACLKLELSCSSDLHKKPKRWLWDGLKRDI